jgi:hypothetical protein
MLINNPVSHLPSQLIVLPLNTTMDYVSRKQMELIECQETDDTGLNENFAEADEDVNLFLRDVLVVVTSGNIVQRLGTSAKDERL